MKSVIYFLLFLLPAVSMAQQSNDQRTVSTKIADVLAKFPADNSKLNDMNVQQLESLGEEGLLQPGDHAVIAVLAKGNLDMRLCLLRGPYAEHTAARRILRKRTA